MPELQEVETVRRGLAPHLAGARLTRVVARRPDLRFPLPEGFVQRLTGARVGDLARRGKYILAPLDRGDTLVIHLGMTGRFTVEPSAAAQALKRDSAAAQALKKDAAAVATPGGFALAAPADPRHAHVVFETEAGARLTYFDARRFGYMDLIETAALEAHARFVAMGPEPLSEAFDTTHLARAFAGRRQGAKTLLLDQSVVAGLGNIYACEALHRARLSPLRPAGEIGPRRLATLVRAVRAVLIEAVEAGGSTLRDYASVQGAMGYFQHDFRAYGRAGQPCPTPRCGGVIARVVQSGRSTFHCPSCQR
jgi:formamidopyrimidine-DNA glycosylase